MQVEEKIRQTIFSAIDELNEQLPAGSKLVKSTETVLFGNDGSLDSLGLVNLIVITEQKLEEVFEVSLTLADERAISQKNSPFKTVKTLVSYIVNLLSEEPDE